MKRFFFAIFIYFICVINCLYGKESSQYNVSQIISQKKYLDDKMYEMGLERRNYPEQELYPLTDGVADINEFLKRKYKLMFVLKEGYDDFDDYGYPLGGGWMITAGDKNGDYPQKVSLTWRRIMQIAYGIFYEQKDFSKVPTIPSSFKGTDLYGRIIKSVIYINTNKMPAYKNSSDPDVRESFYFWKGIIKEQINLYNPDIIIFCGTYRFYKNDFRELFGTKAPADSEMKKYSNSAIVKGAFKDSRNRLFIDAVHPGNGYIKGGDTAYFSDIIQVFTDFR